ncbi:MAG: hypothetical protein IBJ16_11260 [Chitinophagaceae bacterium]|nr:hypothetical protein [Chitinophagaceae bacterium]
MFRNINIFLFFLTLSVFGMVNVQATNVCDTLPIKHITNGELDDWDPASFDIHDLSGIRFAAENDKTKLYVAMYIMDPSLQKRMALAGMQLLIDVKGKKRESTYIEFPVKKDPLSELPAPDLEGQNTSFTERLAAGMLLLKKKGFKDQSQEIEMELIGTESDILLSFGWDERNVLYIEYEIPLKRLAITEDFIGKEIMVGFKLNAQESLPQPPKAVTQIGSFNARLVGVPAGSGPPSARTTGAQNSNSPPPNKILQPQQIFWMKHVLN